MSYIVVVSNFVLENSGILKICYTEFEKVNYSSLAVH